MDFETVRANLARVQESVARIQAREGLVDRVTVIAVTKGHTADAVAAAVHAGATDVGENRVQEGLSKKVEVGDQPVKWHLIGHLQTNKAKYIPGTFGIVHSVDSGKLVRALDVAWGTRKTAGDDDKLRVLIQVNVAGEQQKGGCNPDDLVALADDVNQSQHLLLDGLMTMAPQTQDESAQRSVFSRLRDLRDGLQSKGFRAPELSMGMSGDYEAAVAEGATMVRLGTVLFGERRS